MFEVTSPRNTPSKSGRRIGLAAAALVLAGVLAAPPAMAADLSALQKQAAAASSQAAQAKARAEAAAQQVADARSAANSSASRVGAAASEVADSQQEVNAAGAVLTTSEQKLADAQKQLYATQQQLQDARDYDAKLASDLADAQEALAAAKAAVEAGQLEVDTQRDLMGSAAREEFQQQTPFEGMVTLLGAQTPADLSQRIQWTDTVFDTQTAERARLEVAQRQLQASRDLQTQIEARIAADKAAAAAQVLVVLDLEQKAANEEAGVEKLVAQNKASLLSAQGQLATDQSTLGAAQSAQASAQQQLNSAQGELAASQQAYDQAVADAQQRAAAVKAAIASQSKAQAKADGASSGGSTGSSGGGVSASGFIRPIDASPGSAFGMRFHPILHQWILHGGTDFGASCGTPIYAARGGTVLESRKTAYSGNYTVIGHGTINGVYVTTSYSHQSRMVVSVGQKVSRGQVIGYVGNTGLSTTCHLHLEVTHNGNRVNPMRYIP